MINAKNTTGVKNTYVPKYLTTCVQNLCVKVYYKLINIQLWPKPNFQLYFLDFRVS